MEPRAAAAKKQHGHKYKNIPNLEVTVKKEFMDNWTVEIKLTD